MKMKNTEQLKRSISKDLNDLRYRVIFKEYWTYRNELLNRPILRGNEDELIDQAEKDFKVIDKKIEDFLDFLFYEI